MSGRFRQVTLYLLEKSIEAGLSLSLCLLVSSADDFCKQFRPRSGYKVFDTGGIPKINFE